MENSGGTPASLHPLQHSHASRVVVVYNITSSPSDNSRSGRSSDKTKSEAIAQSNLMSSTALSPIIHPQYSSHSPPSGPSNISTEYDSDQSSAYLTPPQEAHDLGRPPYKPRSGSLESLNMMPASKRIHVSRHKAEGSLQERRHQKRVLEEKRHCPTQLSVSEEDDYSDLSWLPITRSPSPPAYRDYVDRTYMGASVGGQRCERKQRKAQRPQMRSDRHHGATLETRSSLAKPITTNRSTSTSAALSDDKRLPDDGFTDRWKSSPPLNSIAGPVSNLINAVRRRLTLFEVPARHLETPATITLRRASETPSRIPLYPSMKNNNISSTKRKAPLQMELVEPSNPISAYLVNSYDIDSIAKIITQTFLEHSHPIATVPELANRAFEASTSQSLSTVVMPASQDKRVTWDECGLKPRASIVAENATTITDVSGTISQLFSTPGSRASSFKRSNTDTVSSIHTKASVHEVIWEDDGLKSQGSSSSSSSLPDGLKISHRSTSVVPCPRVDASSSRAAATVQRNSDNPKQWPLKPPNMETPLLSNSLLNLPSIELVSAPNNWPGELPDMTPASLEVATTIDTVSPTANVVRNPFECDVVSFPPLIERKQTSDWISPLPDITLSKGADVSLYTLGFDAHTGVGSPSIEVPGAEYFTPSASTSFYQIDSDSRKKSKSEISIMETQSPDIKHQSVHYQNTPQRNLAKGSKEEARLGTSIYSIMAQHGSESSRSGLQSRRSSNAAPQRISDSFSLGSAIGVSTGKRRKSSVHVKVKSRRTTDLRKGDPWQKYRKDSGWPARVGSIFSNSISNANSNSASSSASPVTSSDTSPGVSRACSVQGSKPLPLARRIGSRYDSAIQQDNREWDSRRNKKKSISWVDSKPGWDARSRSEERRTLLQERTPQLTVVDDAGIYKTLTGTRSADEDSEGCLMECDRRLKCKDGRQIESKRKASSKAPSVDWIG